MITAHQPKWYSSDNNLKVGDAGQWSSSVTCPRETTFEGHDADHLADGLTRLCCEVGAPARLLIDRDSAFMKVLKEGHINILDVESNMRKKPRLGVLRLRNRCLGWTSTAISGQDNIVREVAIR